ncbi:MULTISPECIES: LysR substrate-binding domain-containing protein [Rhizobium]|uniref:Carbapenem-hydrolyzing beta-lactamase transcriptional activator n=1 Tax=Rhizobium favelukesii TaxID=348824 RepID=W6RXL4_9HYPH|nr:MULTISPECIES: LysR substrate-binding domain-containing protein [Rhizobium]MCS0461421.1 LysR family transcriptional regulator [Rhizobium favelukesii]UFS83434.1 LysR substrate-binding domain-containing protein [Rhizobium sp. T136]CDM58976.1 Carbapenem-hydrolyzing beta-lactamase transcriptional activator [Rhizobium favelukesii]
MTSVRRAFELISDATETLKPEQLHLTISVTPTFASKWLIPRLPDFTAAQPNIDLRILASDRIANFQTDAVDLAIRYGRLPFGSGLNAELLFENVLVAVGSPLLVEKLGPPGQDGNFPRYPLLHDAHDSWPQFLELAFPDDLPTTAKNIRFNQTSLALEAAIAGQGLALTSTFFVEDDITSGRLLRVLPTELTVGSDFYVVSPRKPRHPASVAAVKRWLADAAGR